RGAGTSLEAESVTRHKVFSGQHPFLGPGVLWGMGTNTHNTYSGSSPLGRTRRGILFTLLAAGLVVAAAPGSAAAAKPPGGNSQFSLKASVNPVLFGRSTVLSGNLKGSG